jgi:hypothetical protein
MREDQNMTRDQNNNQPGLLPPAPCPSPAAQPRPEAVKEPTISIPELAQIIIAEAWLRRKETGEKREKYENEGKARTGEKKEIDGKIEKRSSQSD